MEQEYNKRFKNQELSNEDFDVDGLWADIKEELDEKKKKRPFLIWWKWGLGLVLLLAFGFLFFFQNEPAPIGKNENPPKNASTNQNVEKSSNLDNAKPKSIRKEKSNSNLANQNNTKEASKILSTELSKTNKKKVTKAENELLKSKDKSEINIPERLKSSPLNKELGIIQEEDFQLNVEKITPLRSKNFNEEEVEKNSSQVTKNSAKSKEFALKQIPVHLKPFLLRPFLTPKSLLELNILQKNGASKKQENLKKPPFEVEVYAGINRTRPNFQAAILDTILTQKRTTEKAFYGMTYGLATSISLKKWRLSTGLEFNDLNTELNYEKTFDTLVLSSNVLKLVRLNPDGSIQSQVFADTLITATQATRIVQGYNKYQILSLPLEIGYIKARGKWTFEASIGTSFNFLINQTGQTLDENVNLKGFDNNSNPVLYERFGLSLRTGLSLSYQLNEKIKIRLSPRYIYTKNPKFSSTISSSTNVLNMNLGISRTF